MLNDAEIIEKLRGEIEAAGSLRRWAARHDVSPSMVSHCLRDGKLWPSIAEKLGFRRISRIWADADEIAAEEAAQ
jgi:hypothetical protein